jgi:adenylyltransferase/sulfurtransferase
MPKVLLPTPLRPYAGGSSSVEVPGATVAEALAALVERHAALERHLFDEGGRLRSFVNVYKNDEDVRYLDREATSVSPQDSLSIVPSIAGGSSPIAVDPVTLSNEEIRRYSRHLILPEVGLEGQKKLKAARVLAVGTGGLGSPLAVYLAAAGVGTIGLVDFDVVDDSNLHRQILFGTSDVGKPKLSVAVRRLKELNPNVEVVPFEERLTSENALGILRDFDVVADGTDNFPTRYLVNDACVLTGKPNVYASIFRFEGQASVFWAAKGPCYRCLYSEPPPPGLVPSCAEGASSGSSRDLLGLIQATETIKLVLGGGESLIGRLLLVDALSMRFRELKLRRTRTASSAAPSDGHEADRLRGLLRNRARTGGRRRARDLRRGARGDAPPGRSLRALDVREPHEIEICSLPGSMRVPLGELTENLHRLSTADEIVVHCRSGSRSAKAVAQLKQAGFRKVRNLAGGILAWADRIDPSVPKY